jgi:3-oxoacyl-[acyl-carrier-protein] synthase-3
MDGQESFRVAVASLSDVTGEALASCDCRPEDIGLFVYHQANSRIIRAVGERLRLPADRVVDYVDRFANASTATLPIALSVAEADGRLERDDLVLLAAFGGGLTWGATVMQWSAQTPSARNDQPPARRPLSPA